MTDWVSIPYQPELLTAPAKTKEQKQKEAATKKKKKSKARKLYQPQPDRFKYITEERRQLTLDIDFPESLELPKDYRFKIYPVIEHDEYYGKYIRLGKNFRAYDLLRFFSEFDIENSILRLSKYSSPVTVEDDLEDEKKLESESYMTLGTIKHLIPDCVRTIITNHQEGVHTMRMSTDEMLRTLNLEFLQGSDFSDESISKNSEQYGLQAYFPSVTDGITSQAVESFYDHRKLNPFEMQQRVEAIKLLISALQVKYPVENEEMLKVRDIIGNNISEIFIAIEKLFFFFKKFPFALDKSKYKVSFEKDTSIQYFFYDETRQVKDKSENRFHFNVLNEQLHILSGKVNIRPDLVLRMTETGEQFIYDFKSSIKDPNKLHYRLQSMLYMISKACERIWSSVSENGKYGFIGQVPFSSKWFRDALYEECCRIKFFFVDLKTGEEHEMHPTREDLEELYIKTRRYLEVKVALSGKLKV